MSQSTTPHEFRKLSDNDTVCAECGQDQYTHDVASHQQDEHESMTQQQSEPETTTQHSEPAKQQQNEPETTTQQHETVPQEPIVEPVPAGVMGEPGVGREMKKRNPWLVWLVWPLITLGIYHLVWYYKIHREMAEFQPRRNIPVVGPMLVILFLGWTIIAPFISYFNTGNRIRQAQRSAGIEPTSSPWLGGLLMFVFGVNTLYFQMELNRVIDRYGVPEGTPVQLYE